MSIIDKATFDELKKISGDDFINELIDAFLEDAPNMIRNIHSALATRDIEAFRRNAHSLKSTASTFGATELAMRAKELELLANENILGIGDRLAVLGEAYNRVADAMEELRT